LFDYQTERSGEVFVSGIFKQEMVLHIYDEDHVYRGFFDRKRIEVVLTLSE
jgi:hypothetical protein